MGLETSRAKRLQKTCRKDRVHYASSAKRDLSAARRVAPPAERHHREKLRCARCSSADLHLNGYECLAAVVASASKCMFNRGKPDEMPCPYTFELVWTITSRVHINLSVPHAGLSVMSIFPIQTMDY